MTYRGRVRGGVVVLDGPDAPPEGAEVEVLLDSRPAAGDDDSAPTLYDRMKPFIGIATGLPADFAEQHDHYIHGDAEAGMKAVFADAYFYLALANPTDAGHAGAVRLSRTLRGRIVTTDFVLLELGSSLSRVPLRPLFIDLVAHLRADESVEIVPATRALFDRGFDLFSRRPDKD